MMERNRTRIEDDDDDDDVSDDDADDDVVDDMEQKDGKRCVLSKNSNS